MEVYFYWRNRVISDSIVNFVNQQIIFAAETKESKM